MLVSGKMFEEVRQKIASRVERFHKENPLLPGITREDLRSNLGRRVRPETFRAALDDLLAQKKLEAQGEIVKRAGSTINLEPEEARAKEQIEMAFAAAGLPGPPGEGGLGHLSGGPESAAEDLPTLMREQSFICVASQLS